MLHRIPPGLIARKIARGENLSCGQHGGYSARERCNPGRVRPIGGRPGTGPSRLRGSNAASGRASAGRTKRGSEGGWGDRRKQSSDEDEDEQMVTHGRPSSLKGVGVGSNGHPPHAHGPLCHGLNAVSKCRSYPDIRRNPVLVDIEGQPVIGYGPYSLHFAYARQVGFPAGFPVTCGNRSGRPDPCGLRSAGESR